MTEKQATEEILDGMYAFECEHDRPPREILLSPELAKRLWSEIATDIPPKPGEPPFGDGDALGTIYGCEATVDHSVSRFVFRGTREAK